MLPAVRELRISYTPTRVVGGLPHLRGPADAISILRERLEHEPVEVGILLLTNVKNRLLAIHEVGRGTLDSCPVHPRDVLKAALLANAAGVIVGHNHPSGDPAPSTDDFALYARLRSAAALVGIDLVDFIIVGDGSHFSMKEAGR